MSSCTQKDYIKIGQIISKALEEKQYIEKNGNRNMKIKRNMVSSVFMFGVWCLVFVCVFFSLLCECEWC